MPYASERALILASVGRDAALAAAILAEAKIEALPCKTVPGLVAELQKGAGFAVVAEEVFHGADLLNLSAFLKRQPEWSDFQFILLTFRGGGLERNPAAARLLDVLGNVTFLERPFHPTTLVSLAQAALRGRRRQYEARKRLIAIRESQTKLRAAFASMAEAVFIADAEGRLIDFNDEFVRYHRFKDRGECSRTVADCPIYLDAWLADGTPAPLEQWAMPRALAGETASNVEYRLRRKDSGEIWWGSYNFGPIKDPDGKIIGAVVAARDITKSKEAEKALRESEERFRALATASAYVVYRMNPDWSEMRGLDGHGFLSSTLTPTQSWSTNTFWPTTDPSSWRRLHSPFGQKRFSISNIVYAAPTAKLPGRIPEPCLS